jgi:hypothetical protein
MYIYLNSPPKRNPPKELRVNVVITTKGQFPWVIEQRTHSPLNGKIS